MGETGSWGFLPSSSWLQSRGKFYLSQLFALENQGWGLCCTTTQLSWEKDQLSPSALAMKSRGSSRSRRRGSEGLKSQEEKATFNSSLDLGTQKTWGRRGNAAMGGACHPVPAWPDLRN